MPGGPHFNFIMTHVKRKPAPVGFRIKRSYAIRDAFVYQRVLLGREYTDIIRVGSIVCDINNFANLGVWSLKYVERLYVDDGPIYHGRDGKMIITKPLRTLYLESERYGRKLIDRYKPYSSPKMRHETLQAYEVISYPIVLALLPEIVRDCQKAIVFQREKIRKEEHGRRQYDRCLKLSSNIL